MLERLSRVVPLVDDGGVWRVASGRGRRAMAKWRRAAAAGWRWVIEYVPKRSSPTENR